MRVPSVTMPISETMQDVADEDFELQAGVQKPVVPIEVDYPQPLPTTYDDWERLEIED